MNTRLDELVGPGKKYADIEAYIDSRDHADRFIEQLKTEQASLREELDTRLSYEDFLTRMEAQSRRPEEPRQPDNQPSPPTPKAEVANTTLQDIERIVELREQRKAMESNRNIALSQYAEANGPNHANKLEQQAAELGMTKEALITQASTNPKAFYRLVGLEGTRKQEQFMSPPKTQMNMDNFVPTGSNKKNFEYYDNLRKTDKSQYWQPKVQNEMMKQLADLGDEFYQ